MDRSRQHNRRWPDALVKLVENSVTVDDRTVFPLVRALNLYVEHGISFFLSNATVDILACSGEKHQTGYPRNQTSKWQTLTSQDSKIHWITYHQTFQDTTHHELHNPWTRHREALERSRLYIRHLAASCISFACMNVHVNGECHWNNWQIFSENNSMVE